MDSKLLGVGMKRQNLFSCWRGGGAVVLGLVAAGLGVGVGSAGASVAASASPARDLVVSALPNPVLKGGAATYGFALAATIADRGRAAARASGMRFYLSVDRRLSSHDKRLPVVRVHGLRAGRKETVRESWKVPRRLRAGIYHVLACADVGYDVAESNEHNNCRAAKRTVAVTQPGGRSTKD